MAHQVLVLNRNIPMIFTGTKHVLQAKRVELSRKMDIFTKE